MGSHDDGDGCAGSGSGSGSDGYLLQTSYATGGDDGCIADARRHATIFLQGARNGRYAVVSARVMDLTQLVVSELVTNACKYAPGPVLLELGLTPQTVEVVVWDSDPTVPEARVADPGRIGQHGLEIVKAVAQDLEIRTEPVGKRVTARIALSDTPVSDTPVSDTLTSGTPTNGTTA
ncbi:ATP-binding protein [Streptomyces beigongshangae]|uniref:ATP-binding protein n=1 Tax=Streptomyces beigongshangae TaxID=2841597 RepID=UPI003D315199